MIDLVFYTIDLMNTLTICRLREDLDDGFYLYPIGVLVLSFPQILPHVPKLQWKKADRAAMFLRGRELDLLPRDY